MSQRSISLSAGAAAYHQQIILDDTVRYDLLHRSPGITWMVTPDASAFWHNEAFYEFSGKTPEFMKNWAWQDFLPLEEIPRVATSFYTALEQCEPWSSLHHCRARDDSFRLLSVRAAPLRNGKGDVKYWIGTATDVTDIARVSDSSSRVRSHKKIRPHAAA